MTYERETDRAYVWLRDFDDGEDVYQHDVTGPELRGSYVLDFDSGGRLLGIEVIGASYALPEGTLDAAAPGVHPAS
jgi:uncharacterized protein YuzE